MNFIKKIVDGQVDDSVHSQFTRFGKGDYKGRFLISLWKTKKVKIKTSFEFANDLVAFCSELGIEKVSGLIRGKNDLSKFMSRSDIQGESKPKRGGAVYETTIDSQEMSQEKLQVLRDNSTATLLDIDGADFKLKIKKKLPKPGKSADKVDDGFCKLELDEKYYSKAKEEFFWDMPDAKKISIKHEVIVNEIVVSDELKATKDFARMKEEAQRKGKIIRLADVEGKEIKKEFEFTA